jgi:hypothetical protein
MLSVGVGLVGDVLRVSVDGTLEVDAEERANQFFFSVRVMGVGLNGAAVTEV